MSNAISNSIIQRFHNHISLSQNIDSLKQRIEELNGLKDSIKHMVDVAESGGLRCDEQVDVWLKRTVHHLKLKLKVAHILEKIGKHKSEGAEFNKDNVAQNVLPGIVEQMIDTTVKADQAPLLPYPPADATPVAKLINGCADDSFS
ncbi:hypothetical protein QJS10_CPB22g00877 [Acorus calamus]|uniref:Rx N-terminal domain-containing protein n=1 Tax=Acorus calamus TaxID=4465 RepID=A0AAV9C068_ACOCL|nr:hypothetical protein QJS10_CPB22g00877 [Acorus calamus]